MTTEIAKDSAFINVDGRIKQRTAADAKPRPQENKFAIRDDGPFESVDGRVKQATS
jgi:hypothetical protein